jgi:hypothetical protein
MEKLKLYIKRIVLAVPLVVIAGASFMPLRAWAQQALVLFTLVWFFVMLFSGALGQ